MRASPSPPPLNGNPLWWFDPGVIWRMSLEGFYFIASSPSSWSGSIECNETICWAWRGQPHFGEQYNFNNYIFVCCYNSQIQFLERHGYCWPVPLKALAILIYILEKCVVIEKVLFYRTLDRSLSTLVTNSINHWLTGSLQLLRLDWCDPVVKLNLGSDFEHKV